MLPKLSKPEAYLAQLRYSQELRWRVVSRVLDSPLCNVMEPEEMVEEFFRWLSRTERENMYDFDDYDS
jgi:hypothetical protein